MTGCRPPSALDTASLDLFSPALQRHRDVTTSYVSGRRMLLDVALGCSCQTPLFWPGCRSSLPAVGCQPSLLLPPLLLPSPTTYLSPVLRPPHSASRPPACQFHLATHVNHSCALSPPTRLPSRLQPRDARTPPERSNPRIAPNLPCTIPNTSTQMSWSRLALSSELSPQWIQIRNSWLRRR